MQLVQRVGGSIDQGGRRAGGRTGCVPWHGQHTWHHPHCPLLMSGCVPCPFLLVPCRCRSRSSLTLTAAQWSTSGLRPVGWPAGASLWTTGMVSRTGCMARREGNCCVVPEVAGHSMTVGKLGMQPRGSGPNTPNLQSLETARWELH